MQEEPDTITVYLTTGNKQVFTGIQSASIQADCFIISCKDLVGDFISTILPMVHVRAIETEKYADRTIN